MILSAENCGCPTVVEGATLVDSPVCGGSNTLVFMSLLQAFLFGRCDIAEPCKRIVSEETLEAEYDFIVIGAGTAGSIVAGRLTENDDFDVLLLEAGGPAPIASRVPSFYRSFWADDVVDWRYYTKPGNYCLETEGKGCQWIRGKALGGSSFQNGMMYHRGHPADYDKWVSDGATGWSWEENKPFFDMTEGNKEIGTVVSGQYHSDKGPLPVQRFTHQPNAVFKLMQAINDTGLEIIQDMNNLETPVGFNIAQTFNDNGQRYTTARVYLKPKSERPNLSVRMHARVSRVLFRGPRAVAVEFYDENTRERNIVRAKKEVILSAGALNTPQILILSGVGPKQQLQELGIPLVADLPVGQNLRNHIGVTLNFILRSVNNTYILNWAELAQYLLKRDHVMSSTGLTQLTGLQYSSKADRAAEQPDLQFFFNGFYAECAQSGQVGEPVAACHGNAMNVSSNAVNINPKSVGEVTLNSTDPFDAPIFDANYFDNPEDMEVVKEGMQVLKRIFDSEKLQEEYGIELDPASTVPCKALEPQWSEDWMECMIRLHTDPQNHQLGTASMGPVLDPALKVHNLLGLRVIDASSMPNHITGNPQGAIMMVAERGAHLIQEDYKS